MSLHHHYARNDRGGFDYDRAEEQEQGVIRKISTDLLIIEEAGTE